MLPRDWAKPNSPATTYRLPEQRDALEDRYSRIAGADRAFPEIFRIACESLASDAAGVEYDYIDADYRDEFANFYATTYRPLPDRCERVHFLRAGEYVGFTVIRPIIERPICRTLLPPPPELAGAVSTMTACEVHPYGHPYTAEGFPFLSQDYQFGVCAHAAIWMIAHYHHLERSHGRYFISDIVEAAQQHEVARSIPSTGLHQLQIAAAFRRLKLPPLQYVADGLTELDESFERLACRFLNSRMPVLLLVPEHAVVLIGYGKDENGELFFVAHDDRAGPYQKIPAPDGDGSPEWKGLVVPLPGKIYLTAEAAERTGRENLEALIATEEHLEPLRRISLRFRTYVISSAQYKGRLLERGLPADVAWWHRYTGASNWIWVVEAQDEQAAANGRDCVVGEIAIDATSDPLTPYTLFGNLPDIRMRWNDLNGPMSQADSSQGLDLRYATGSAIHV